MDEIDRRIISQLQSDGRITYEDLAKQVGLTGVGVKKRIRKLLDKGLVTISALLNIEKLNLSPALVLLEMEGAEAMRETLNRFKECPRVVHMFSTLGGYNLVALIIAENQGTLESISMEKCSLRSGRGIRRSEFYPIGKMFYSPFLPLREDLVLRKKAMAPCGVDCISCESFGAKRCVACPVTHHYQGSL